MASNTKYIWRYFSTHDLASPGVALGNIACRDRKPGSSAVWLFHCLGYLVGGAKHIDICQECHTKDIEPTHMRVRALAKLSGWNRSKNVDGP